MSVFAEDLVDLEMTATDKAGNVMRRLVNLTLPASN